MLITRFEIKIYEKNLLGSLDNILILKFDQVNQAS